MLALVEGLRAFPTVNASADGTTMVLHREINVGIAVALDWGLIVPVLKNSEEKNFLGLARGINDLAERARAKKLKPEEVQAGFECGIGLSDYQDLKDGDIIETYDEREIPRT